MYPSRYLYTESQESSSGTSPKTYAPPWWKHSNSGVNSNFQQNHRRWSLYITGVDNLFSIYWQGGITWDWGWGGNFSKIIDRRSHRGTCHRVIWTGCNKKHAILATCKKLLLNEYLKYSFSWQKRQADALCLRNLISLSKTFVPARQWCEVSTSKEFLKYGFMFFTQFYW